MFENVSFLLILLISRVLKDKKQEAMVRHEVHRVFQLSTNDKDVSFFSAIHNKIYQWKEL